MSVLPAKTNDAETTFDTEDDDRVEMAHSDGIDLADNGIGQAHGDDAVPSGTGFRGWVRAVVAHWRVVAACLALSASAALVGGLYVGQYRVDEQTSAAEAAVVSAASQGTVALLSYAPDTLDRDLAAAQSHLTGEFLTYYRDFANQIVGPAAKEGDVRATASVVRAAPAEVHADTARVLIFLDQTTTSRDNPDPVQSASSVMVGLTKVDQHWLISTFDPM